MADKKPDRVGQVLFLATLGIGGLVIYGTLSAANETSSEARWWTNRYDRLRGRGETESEDDYDDDYEE